MEELFFGLLGSHKQQSHPKKTTPEAMQEAERQLEEATLLKGSSSKGFCSLGTHRRGGINTQPGFISLLSKPPGGKGSGRPYEEHLQHHLLLLVRPERGRTQPQIH